MGQRGRLRKFEVWQTDWQLAQGLSLLHLTDCSEFDSLLWPKLFRQGHICSRSSTWRCRGSSLLLLVKLLLHLLKLQLMTAQYLIRVLNRHRLLFLHRNRLLLMLLSHDVLDIAQVE